MAEVRLIVYCQQPLSDVERRHLEQDLHLNIEINDSNQQVSGSEYFLNFENETSFLKLCKTGQKDHGIFIDFIADMKGYQKQKLSAKKDLLARAVGVEPGLSVCDMTLGFSGDAFKLAYLGANVVGSEELKIIWTLTENALWRFQNSKTETPLSLKAKNISCFDLVQQDQNFDVYFFDPMYSHERRALPRKGMQYLSDLAENRSEESYRSVIQAVLDRKKKLVIKRAPQAAPFLNLKPRHSLDGKMVRFDVY